MAVCVAFDTSFLIFLARRKVTPAAMLDLFDGPVSAYTSQGVINELHLISHSTRSSSGLAGMGLRLVKALGIKVVPDTRKPDEWLLEQPAIATADMRLSRAARRNGIKVISITRSNKVIAR